jgi:hypothetical protein
LLGWSARARPPAWRGEERRGEEREVDREVMNPDTRSEHCIVRSCKNTTRGSG